MVHAELYKGARIVAVQTNANGDMNDPVVLAVYKEIVDL